MEEPTQARQRQARDDREGIPQDDGKGVPQDDGEGVPQDDGEDVPQDDSSTLITDSNRSHWGQSLGRLQEGRLQTDGTKTN